MLDTRIKISSVVENQLPEYVREEFPLVAEFLSEYYNALEQQGGALDILNNIDQYVKLEHLTDLTEETTTTSDLNFGDTSINVASTKGFPDSYGLIKIGSEIIAYKSKTDTSFDECARGFSGTTSLRDATVPDQLVFSESEIEEHQSGSNVSNLSILFLKEFFVKVKKQFVPGFADRNLYSGLNQELFAKQAKDFYSSKGTNSSFEILFRALYGEDVEVIRPSDNLLISSDADYRISRDLVVESIDGDPFELVNRTFYQDNDEYFPSARGTVNNVEKILRGEKEYFVLSLDYDASLEDSDEFPEFSIHSSTKLITECSIGAETLDVDSTLGFPGSGTIIANMADGTTTTITYTSKSYTQFYGCSGVDQNLPSGQDLRIDSTAYGIVDDQKILVKVTGVLSELDYATDTKLHTNGERIIIKSLGRESEDIRANNWIFNVSNTYDIDTLVLSDSVNFSYTVTTIDQHTIFAGDKVKFIFNDSTEVVSSVIDVLNLNSFVVSGQGSIDISRKFKIQRLITKTDTLNFPEASIFSTGVQNTYQEGSNSFYVTSSSLPNYLNETLSTKNPSVIFSGTFNGENLSIGIHPFYTGDIVFYSADSDSNSLGISNQAYFIKKVDAITVKLSRSRSNLLKDDYISFDNVSVTNSKLVLNKLSGKGLDNQKLIRKIEDPIYAKNKFETNPGPIGILVNGVEILNYKSEDSVFYGPIEKIDILSPGSDYDVVNPPPISIVDSIGFGATVFPEVEGSFQEIQVIDGGFDYTDKPTISVVGGSGSGVVAEPQMIEYRHSSTFDSDSGVDLSNNKITFQENHRFKTGEKIIYAPDDRVIVSGLDTSSSYFVSVLSDSEISLHRTFDNALNNTSPIDLTAKGNGIHKFNSANLKKKIASVIVTDTGTTYRNRKISIDSVGINTFSNTITAKNHRYLNGEIITYTSSSNPVSGLDDGRSYYVTVVDEDTFKLSEVGTASTIGVGTAFVGVSTISDFYFKNKNYINFKSAGDGIHSFNYPEIRVVVGGKSGISTSSTSDNQAILRPIVKGEIKSTFVQSGGYNYGSEEILNFNRQPLITAPTGSGAELLPILLNGKIDRVFVITPGSGYVSVPNIKITGPGVGAELIPIIKDGLITEVKVLKTGINYTSAELEVIPSGSGVEFLSTPKKWTINVVERSLQTNQINDDDGILFDSINSEFGFQYTHAYAPRKLRRTVSSRQIVNGEISFSPDLALSGGRESTSKYHSPIIGWAYDGNPIYGPYGYSSITGGSAKILKSGYRLVLSSSRPSISIYPEGFFIEDFVYQSNGDLDQYNGRFCSTPEFPNGIYAYFSTINDSIIESSGTFKNYRKPVFPYFIGSHYKSKLNEYNTSPLSNQDNIDLSDTKVFRNVTPYNLSLQNSGYDYLINPNDIKKQESIIRFSGRGSIGSIGIVTGGFNYKVGDVVEFDNIGSEGDGASAEVSTIKGKEVNSVQSSSISIDGVEIVQLGDDGMVGLTTTPHNLMTGDVVSLTGFSTFIGQDIFVGPVSTISNRSNINISVGVGTTGITGIVTYFSVRNADFSFPNLRANDILSVNSEKVRVLETDENVSRIKVLREIDGTTGVEHGVGSVLAIDSKVLSFSLRIPDSSERFNREIYFNPVESIGIGTLSTVGSGTTLFFSNPGTGKTTFYIPTRSIYLPNHNLETGDELIYSSNGGTPITASTNGIATFQLFDNQTVFAAKINDNLIGIATHKVGLGTNGSFIALDSSINSSTLYFTNNGSGDIHSFETNFDVLTADLTKNSVTVSTAATHGLSIDDSVNISCTSGLSTTFIVNYNDHNRRLLINPKSFEIGDVDASLNTIYIQSHGYKTGQKVIHTSTAPAGGLENNQIYYIIKDDADRVKLSKVKKGQPVDITSASQGALSLINPPISAVHGQQVIFDLSDSSLSYPINFVNYPAFKLKFYTDPEFIDDLNPKNEKGEVIITENGKIGVDSDANVILKVSKDSPREIYYNLVPIDLNINEKEKLEIISDPEDVIGKNRLLVVPSVYTGTHSIVGTADTSFTYNVLTKPESDSYVKESSFISYDTDSINISGEISSISITSGGRNYKKLPKFNTIKSDQGSEAVLEFDSETIGKLSTTEIVDIGFDYPSDTTLRPTAKVPNILKVESNSRFKKIGISSVGSNYTIAPSLIVLDALTNEVIDDVDLEYEIGDKEVSIIRNTTKLSGIVPKIIPTNNSNGVGINSITFNEVTKDVIVGLGISYSSESDFPFSVGDKVLIENINVGVGTGISKGYNSSDYKYSLFTLTSIHPNIGGANGTVTYSLDSYIESGENPGTFDLNESAGLITPEKFFPTFNVEIDGGNFNIGEEVVSQTKKGIVENWNSDSGLLAVSTVEDFEVGESIRGISSRTQADIQKVTSSEGSYKVSSSSIVRKGFQRETGFLNNDTQRLHDSDYYQYFSYALKSKVQYEDWNDSVSALNHTAGFKKFSDLIVESVPVSSGISTDQNFGELSVISDFISEIDLNCYNDYDLATENNLSFTDQSISNRIRFNSSTLQDFFESVGNRVLTIDDISSQFNSNPRSTKYSIVDTFKASEIRSKKYFAYILDRRFIDEKQFTIASLIHNDNFGFLNQYGTVYTVSDLGYFDFIVDGLDAQLLFFPNKFKNNDYSINLISFDIKDSISGIGSTDLGDSVKIKSSTKTLAPGTSTSTNLIGINSTSRSSKIVLQYGATDNSYFEYDELTLIHDGTTVDILEYGQLSTDTLLAQGSIGLGTYNAYLSGSELKLDLTPNVGLGVTVNVNAVSIELTDSSSSTIGSEVLKTGKLESAITSIASSTSPISTVIAEYESPYSAAYYIVSLEDTTNNQYQVSEIVIVSDGTTSFMSEFGENHTGSSLGQFESDISGGKTRLKFTALPNADVEVTVFQNTTAIHDNNYSGSIDFTNSSISIGVGKYDGTENDIKRSFNMSSKGKPVFRRDLTGNSSNVVDVQNNSVKIANHYFVTGEELSYTPESQDSSGSIGITTVSIVGIGTTDKLPSTVYAIKVSDYELKFAATAENALKTIPEPLTLTSVGIGTSHSLTARKQNTRVLLTIDNIIQSPIVSSAITSLLTADVSSVDQLITISGITSLTSGNLLQIGNEIMKINTIGVGNTNTLAVERPVMGTGISSHLTGSLVRKVSGDYNIINNSITFASSPQGLTPIGTVTDGPNNADYLGIATHSTFSGRVFVKSGVPNTDKGPYENNYILDDISEQFNGITTAFNLTSSDQNVTGISTDSGIILVNNIFQGPESNYSLRENLGITSISFSGTASTTSYDVNHNNLPKGGIIVSVGASKGFGYQPTVAAGGTAIVSAAGTITGISIGNSGSGYRSGIQTVSVGVDLPTTLGTNIVNIGTASISDGNVTSVAITTDRVFYAPRDVSNVLYSNTTGLTTVTTSSPHGLMIGDEIVVSGIAFTCNYTGTQSVEVTNAIYDSVTGIMTVTTNTNHNLSTTGKNSDVILTGLGFTCGLDNGGSIHTYPRTTDPAYCGAPVLAVNSSIEFVINAGVSTVPTFYQSGGTSQPAIIAPRVKNNSASGIDPAADGSLVLRVIDDTTFEINSGISTREHFYARCGKVNKPLDIVFDEPLSYSNIPLVYSSYNQQTGFGTGAKINIVVGQGSSIVDFEITNFGYGYGNSEILTVDLGGTVGIPTNTAIAFEEFQIIVDSTFSDSFSGWSFGNLLVLDSIEDQFDNNTKLFRLSQNGEPKSIKAGEGSDIDVQATLLIFINDILQVPGESYSFTGGSFVEFSEAPKVGDKIKIIFYQGNADIDVRNVDILETIKEGDTVRLYDEDASLNQKSRLTTKVLSIDEIQTNSYPGPGLSVDESYQRSLTWCKQSDDLFINGKSVSKDRVLYEPLIYPNTKLIQSVGTSSTVIFVESVRTFFDNYREGSTLQDKIRIVSQDNIVGASATAVVSNSGISTITITNPGFGYTTAPSVIIAGSATTAVATATLSGSSISVITVSSPGTGYTSLNPPSVLIETPVSSDYVEDIESVSYSGDFGIVSGVSTVSVGSATTGIVFDLVIPENSSLRDSSIVGTALTVSGIQTGYYFVVYNSNVGSGLTSLGSGGSVVSVGNSFLDNVYYASAVSIAQTSVSGFGVTYVAKVTVSVSDYEGLSGIGYSSFFGEYSWGRIETPSRPKPKTFSHYNNGLVGVSTSPRVERFNPLKYLNYN